MGLEAINFYFHSGEPIRSVVKSNDRFYNIENNKYAYKNEGEFWIDIEFQDDYSLSLRIALCNPLDKTLLALDNLFSLLFRFKNSTLKDLYTKEIFKTYDQKVCQKIKELYENKKKIFTEIYGGYTAAISSEKFYWLYKKNNHR